MTFLTEEQLRARGFRRSFEEIAEEAREMAAWTLSAMPVGRMVEDPKGELTRMEVEVLERCGATLESRSSNVEDPLARTAAKYAAMLATGLSTGEAARMLGVSAGRIRQRLSERTLYGVNTGRGYRLPAFQFEGGDTVPRIGKVLRALPVGLHPLGIQNWFTVPNPDLFFDEAQTPVSPRDWLLGGGSPEALIARTPGDILVPYTGAGSRSGKLWTRMRRPGRDQVS